MEVDFLESDFKPKFHLAQELEFVRAISLAESIATPVKQLTYKNGYNAKLFVLDAQGQVTELNVYDESETLSGKLAEKCEVILFSDKYLVLVRFNEAQLVWYDTDDMTPAHRLKLKPMLSEIRHYPATFEVFVDEFNQKLIFLDPTSFILYLD